MADRFWIGDTGNTNDTANWSTSSGGAGGASIPTLVDNAIFDNNSFSTTGLTVTVNAAFSCFNLDFSAVTNNPTFAGNQTLNIYGSMTLSASMSWTFFGTTYFRATTSQTITTNGINLRSNTYFNGNGGTWTLQDDYTMNLSGRSTYLQAGHLDLNDQLMTFSGTFTITSSSVKELSLGSQGITINTYDWNVATTTNLTFNKETGTINCGGNFKGAGLTYGDVVIGPVVSRSITGENTFANLTINGGTNNGASYFFEDNQTITGTFTVSANTEVYRVLIAAGTDNNNLSSTPITITANAVSIDYADFSGITASGASTPWTGTLLGDVGLNTNITFRTADDYYWIGDTGNHIDGSKWSLLSGGAAASAYPVCHDNIIFDANSFSTTGQTVTMDGRRPCTNMTFSGVTNSPTFAFSIIELLGNVILDSSVTYPATGQVRFMGPTTGTRQLTTNGATLYSLTMNLTQGTLQLQDDLTLFTSTGGVINYNGTFDANDFDLDIPYFNASGSNAKVVYMGSGTWTLFGTTTLFNVGSTTNTTVYAETSVINITIDNGTDRNFYIGSNVTLNEVNFDGTGSGALRFYDSSGGSITTFNVDSSGGAKYLVFYRYSTHSFGTFNLVGTSGNEIYLNSTNAGLFFNLYKIGGGTVTCNYLVLQDSMALNGNWFAGDNSTDTSNNHGWFFQTTPDGPSGLNRLSGMF